ncbi:MAG: hypothetical protein B6241_12725 [Spirochaetaceae bacterium 4572_59]|nr:MAG: hypothetical protein B6241_12725 [Spirochaetaceae bacterium 4572_59]
MGMGRNILRQSTLTAALFACSLFSLNAFSADKYLLRSDHSSSPSSVIKNKDEALDTHRNIAFWSVPISDHPKIKQYIEYFGKGTGLDYVNRCLIRAQPYWDFIASRLEEKDMPAELIYLPLIESAYKIDAVSRSGATGLWQFMMNSIGPYDITVDTWRDDRRDFWRATEGALNKLEYNYSVTGDWLLALAAYNCGLNKVRKTIKASGISNYWELCEKKLLPRETRNYIPKLAAVAYLCEFRGKAGIPLTWTKSPEWLRIPLKRSVDIRRVARKAEVPESLLLLAHSELNYTVTPPSHSTYYLKTPEKYRQQIEAVLAEDSNLISFKRYQIQSGDTLSEIAQWYRIPISHIKEYNQGVENRYLRIGQTLLIPIIDESIPDRPGNIPDNSGEFWSGEYTVLPGDSLWKIALLHKSSPEEIAAGNGLPLETTIVPGMRLIVPGPGE